MKKSNGNLASSPLGNRTFIGINASDNFALSSPRAVRA